MFFGSRFDADQFMCIRGSSNGTRGSSPPFMPEPIASDWFKWLVGHWRGTGQSSAGTGVSDMTIELSLNGQFLIFTSEDSITEMTDEQKENLKRAAGATDQEIERFRKLPFREIQLQTIDPGSGEILGYLFDSLRCVAVGRGRLEGNKQTMSWEWSIGGKGTSTSVVEKLDSDTFAISGTYETDGQTVDDTACMIMKRQPLGK